MQNSAIQLGPSAGTSARLPTLHVVGSATESAIAPTATAGRFATKAWKAFWAASGVVLTLLVLAQVTLRLDVDYTL